MNTEFRNRAVLPVLLPLGVLLGIAALIVGVAFIFLYSTQNVAVVLAIVAAGGILAAIALAASKDELTGAQKGAVGMLGVLPVALGALFAFGGVIDVDPEKLGINAQPLVQVPEGAEIGSANAEAFCLPPVEGECEDISEWEMAAQEGETFVFEYVNLQADVGHNVQIFELAGSAAAPEAGDEILAGAADSPVIAGGSIVYTVPQALEPGQYYFNCIVHPNMDGVLTITEGEDAAA
jgi:plastocyanin